MAWEQVQNVGEALPWGADMGALLDPLPCMGGGGSHDMGAGRNFWVSGAVPSGLCARSLGLALRLVLDKRVHNYNEKT